MHETKTTTVTLTSKTEYPLETIYCQWRASRESGPIPSPEEVHRRMHMTWAVRTPQEIALEAEVRSVFEQVVSMKIPVAETLDFIFLIEHLPIACREQMVRHRIGHRFGERLGADIIPDIAESTWWSQTMRVLNMGTFASEGEYLMPEWLKINGNTPMPGFKTPNRCPVQGCNSMHHSMVFDGSGNWQCSNGHVYDPRTRTDGRTIAEFYHEQMVWIQSAYNRMIKAGMPIEDARNILPLGLQHRLTWKLNLSSLQHVLSKRGCWIAQLGMWEPIIVGMVEELATKVDPYFRTLIDPPCIGTNGKFESCKFDLENKNRLPTHPDPHVPCSLWVNHEYGHEMMAIRDSQKKEYIQLKNKYGKLWGRDPETGNRHPAPSSGEKE